MNNIETLPLPNWAKFRGELKAFVLRKVRDTAVADDIVQDVFLKVQSRISQLHESEKILGWIYQIARNTISDHYRRQSRELRVDDIDWETNWQALNECVTHCLKETLISLPPVYREVLELTELKNISQTELATRLNISYSGVKSRVQRARQMLREKMEQQYRIEMDKYGNVLVCENRVPCNCAQEFKEACE